MFLCDCFLGLCFSYFSLFLKTTVNAKKKICMRISCCLMVHLYLIQLDEVLATEMKFLEYICRFWVWILIFQFNVFHNILILMSRRVKSHFITSSTHPTQLRVFMLQVTSYALQSTISHSTETIVIFLNSNQSKRIYQY